VPIETIDRYYFELPSVLKWAAHLSLASAGVSALLLLPEQRLRIPRGPLLALLGLMGLALLSCVVNDSGVLALIVAQRGWILALLVMLALKTAYGRFDRDRLYALLVYAGLASSVVSALQRFLVVPFVSGPDAGDRVTGLFSVGYIQVYFHLFCIAVVLAYWLNGREVIPHPFRALLVLFLSLGVGNERASLPYLMSVILFVIWRCGLRQSLRRGGRLIAALLVLPGVMLGVFSLIYQRTYGEEEQRSYGDAMTDQNYLKRYMFGDENTQFTSGGALRRGAAVLWAWREISDRRDQLLLGEGPGATAESRLPGGTGRLARKYPGYAINRTSLSMLLADLGLVGLALYALLLASVWRARDPADRPEHARVREAFVMISAAFSVYANALNEPVHALVLAVLCYPALGVTSPCSAAPEQGERLRRPLEVLRG